MLSLHCNEASIVLIEPSGSQSLGARLHRVYESKWIQSVVKNCFWKTATSFTFCLRPLYTWDITKYVVFCQNILNSFTFFNSVNESLLLILPDSEVLNELCEFQKGFKSDLEDFKESKILYKINIMYKIWAILHELCVSDTEIFLSDVFKSHY